MDYYSRNNCCDVVKTEIPQLISQYSLTVTKPDIAYVKNESLKVEVDRVKMTEVEILICNA